MSLLLIDFIYLIFIQSGSLIEIHKNLISKQKRRNHSQQTENGN